MKKNITKILSIVLAIVTIFSTSAISLTASAASNTSYTSYNSPENSGDYAYWNGKKVVKSSSTTKDEIRWMQAAINYCIAKEGLKTSYIAVDGSFGPGSKTATIAFQKAAGLTADGSFGPSSIKKMKSILNDGKPNSLAPVKTTKYNLCWPVSSSVSKYKNVTSSLGNRNDPISGAAASHKGIDIGIPTGSSVLATYGGIVKFVGSNSARGKYVVIYHDDIDCMPSLGMMTFNALCSADSVIIPTTPEFLSAKGLEQLLGTINRVKRRINPDLKIDGILITMVDNRTRFGRGLANLIRQQYGKYPTVFNTVIPRSIRAVETAAEGKSIYLHDKNGKVAEAYANFTKEVMNDGKTRQRVKSSSELIR